MPHRPIYVFLFCFIVFFLNFSQITINQIRATSTEKIDVNTAPIEDLIKIVHIGEKRATEIISLRPFYSLDGLIKIKGIGEKTLESIKNQGLAWVNPARINLSQQETSLPIEPYPKTETNTLSGATNKPPKIDINTALLEDLIKISYIGKTRAEELIFLRPFYSLDELIRIRGIGEKTLESIKNQGLAWIDPELKTPKIEKEDTFSEKNLAMVSNPINQSQINPSKSVFLIAFSLAIFSGIIILILRQAQYKY